MRPLLVIPVSSTRQAHKSETQMFLEMIRNVLRDFILEAMISILLCFYILVYISITYFY